MKVIYTKNELFSLIEGYKKEGKCVGFVPTMGALHNGHLSLVKACKNSCDIAVTSVFVNPTQFNDPEDLKRYPRTPEKDAELLKTAGCDLVFMPSVEEIYPEKDTRKFDFGYLETVMEGAKRPGHFNGVGQVVSRLFDIVQPHKAFFGMKDFQQVAIIKNMVNQLKYNIEIIPCPIVREESGLALSSRNALLEEEHKKNAPHIYATLKKARNLVAEMSVADLKKWITEEINNNPYLETEYVEIVDDTTLKVIENWNEKGTKVVCVAVYAGKIRLIDNIIL
ncbi:pantoate--beta-alanine ligase [Culturomica massiliensis]|jgi:pantoate--beta-alanine ligase|uniref:pantoate--beta-alanine ligase n=1 Tax=Culturomica massiliensis TaxID=1841857 RepID=UPI000838A080|nr:pantoate--beta-alanine ligase [Culturomica massiliensis]